MLNKVIYKTLMITAESAKMQGPTGTWNFQRPGVKYTRYTENMEWNQNFRPQGPRRGNIESCDYQHWCETCDKGFATVNFLENHKLQHQKCSIDGCQFVAHPKIITKHIQMQHSTGIFKRIAKLNNPEDIEKWREERKRKYPTIENIKKKEAAVKEKINRGEKMGMKNGRSNRNDKTEFHHKANQRPSQTGKAKHPQEKYIKNMANNQKRVATDLTKRSNLSKKICKAIPSVEECRTLKPFAGIQSLQIEDNLDLEIELQTECSIPIEDDEDIDSADTEQKDTSVLEPSVCSALTSLMCCYESSDEDDVKTIMKGIKLKKPLNENKTTTKSNDKLSSPVNQTNCAEKVSENTNVKLQDSERILLNGQGASDDESGPLEVKISKEDISMPVDNTQILKTRPTNKLSAKNINRPQAKKYEYRKRNKLSSTLLEKLLHREIQHERNVILQCVRYVVKNKYFENS